MACNTEKMLTAAGLFVGNITCSLEQSVLFTDGMNDVTFNKPSENVVT